MIAGGDYSIERCGGQTYLPARGDFKAYGMNQECDGNLSGYHVRDFSNILWEILPPFP